MAPKMEVNRTSPPHPYPKHAIGRGWRKRPPETSNVMSECCGCCDCSGVAQTGVITFQKNKLEKREREREKSLPALRRFDRSVTRKRLIWASHKLWIKFTLQSSPAESQPLAAQRLGLRSGKKSKKGTKNPQRSKRKRRICLDDSPPPPQISPPLFFLCYILPLPWPLIQLNSALCTRFPNRWRGGLPVHHIFHKAFCTVAALQNVLTYSCSVLGKTQTFRHV